MRTSVWMLVIGLAVFNVLLFRFNWRHWKKRRSRPPMTEEQKDASYRLLGIGVLAFCEALAAAILAYGIKDCASGGSNGIPLIGFGTGWLTSSIIIQARLLFKDS